MKLQLGFAGERYIYLPLKIIEQAKVHPLTEGLYIKFLGHFVNAKFHYIDRPSGCGDYIMLYCSEGEGWVEVENEKYILKENSFIILPPQLPHRYGATNSNPWSLYWFHFQGKNADYISKSYYKPYKFISSSTSRINERLEIFEQIYQILSINQTIDYLCYANSHFIHLVSTLIYDDVYRDIKKQQFRQNNYDNNQLINRLTHYMNENIDRKLTIDDLSHFINLSPSYLHRIFTKHFGVAPLHYFSKLKMNMACDLLLNTSLKINQISAKLSYNDSMYFSRQFKKIIGVSPKEFRENSLQQ